MLRLAVVIMLLLSHVCAAQYTQTLVQYPNGNMREIERYRVSLQGGGETGDQYRQDSPSLTGYAYVGKQDNAPDLKNTFRMIYGFDLSSIPENSEIVSVKLYATITFTSNMQSPTYEFDVYSFPSNGPGSSSGEENWTSTEGATKLIDLPAISTSTSWRYMLLDTYYPTHAFAQYIENSFDKTCWISIKSADESWASGSPTIHVMDFKDNAGTVIEPASALKIEIVYRPYHIASFINEEGAFSSGPDFKIAGVWRNHPYSELWQPADSKTIENAGHPLEPLAADDNREYYWGPQKWEWYYGSGLHDASTNTIWSGLSITDDATFKALHFREVDNQYYTVYEETGSTVYNIPFTVDGQSWTSGSIYTSHAGAENSYDAIFPFLFTDPSTNRVHYMVNITNDTYGSYSTGSGGIITLSTIPNYHHKDTYSNSHKAEYQNFMFMDR